MSFCASIDGEDARPYASGGRPDLYNMVCAVVGATHTTAIPTARAMKMPSWLNKTKNDDEASSSSSARRRRITSCTAPVLLLRDLPLAPRPEDYVTLPPHVVAAARPRRNHRYVPLDECERWRDGEGIDHNDVSLPTGWHLNRARAPVQPVP
jgi:hypothetical protein